MLSVSSREISAESMESKRARTAGSGDSGQTSGCDKYLHVLQSGAFIFAQGYEREEGESRGIYKIEKSGGLTGGVAGGDRLAGRREEKLFPFSVPLTNSKNF